MAETPLKKLLESPIDRKDAAVAPLLRDLQGDILKPHGRDHSVHVFLQFQSSNGALTKAKKWIGKFAKEYVTSAQKQFEEVDKKNKSGTPGGLFASFFLTSKGYDILGIRPPSDPKFINGMKASRRHLADPDSKQWQGKYKKDIHAAIFLAHDDDKELTSRAAVLLKEVKEFVVAEEWGHVQRNKNKTRHKKGEPIEPFGYVDGRSQPLFLIEDIEKEKSSEHTPYPRKYDPSAPPKLVLVRDPNGEGEMSYGSYLVFRKLEQNVRDFNDAVKALAKQLEDQDEERAAALVVGRFKDGTPIVRQKKKGLIDPVQNNFDYSEDPYGNRCPLHAHIRQVNPRGLGEEERDHRIARRAIPYDERPKKPEDNLKKEDPTEKVGLLFICFQSSITDQFEFIQRYWANDKDLSRRKIGADPLIGQSDGPVKAQDWPKSRDGHDRIDFSFAGFVKLKGGEYFFAPSISGLIKIGG